MTDLSIGMVSILMFASLAVLMFAGFPVGFALAAVGIIFTVLVWNVNSLPLMIRKVYDLINTLVLLATPLFILMGCILERSGIADDLYALMYGTMGRLKGGLAMGTVVACTVMAAMIGVSSAAVVTMGVVALPSMLKRSYDKQIATGCVMAGGALGILIPPSVPMILFGLFAQESVGKLFSGGMLPGLLLSGLFCIYIGVRCYLQPGMGPGVRPEEAFNLKQTLVASKGVILPIALVAAVLGSIFTGIATPTEASAVGAFVAFLAALVKGKFTFALFKEVLYTTFRISGMIVWVIVGASLFTAVYIAIGASQLITQMFMTLPVNPYVIVILTQLVLFFLGWFIDPVGIIILTTPVFVPVMRALGFDIVWYGVLLTMNLEMALLTPPFALNIFFLKGVTPPDITMTDLYKAVIPFVAIQALGLAIVMIFPQIALYLPNLWLGPK